MPTQNWNCAVCGEPVFGPTEPGHKEGHQQAKAWTEPADAGQLRQWPAHLRCAAGREGKPDPVHPNATSRLITARPAA